MFKVFISLVMRQATPKRVPKRRFDDSSRQRIPKSRMLPKLKPPKRSLTTTNLLAATQRRCWSAERSGATARRCQALGARSAVHTVYSLAFFQRPVKLSSSGWLLTLPITQTVDAVHSPRWTHFRYDPFIILCSDHYPDDKLFERSSRTQTNTPFLEPI